MVRYGIKGICACLTLTWLNYLLIADTEELCWILYKDLMPIKAPYHSKLLYILYNRTGIVLQLNSVAHFLELS